MVIHILEMKRGGRGGGALRLTYLTRKEEVVDSLSMGLLHSQVVREKSVNRCPKRLSVKAETGA